MAKSKIAGLLEGWMADWGQENGYELSRCEYVKEGPDKYLRVYVDKLVDGEYGSMDTDDCEKVSRYLSEKLDETDPIPENYYLEVSSPGLDRPLLTQKDFERFMGSEIEISLYQSIDGSKQLSGTLKAYNDGVVTIESNGKEISVNKDQAGKINLAVVF